MVIATPYHAGVTDYAAYREAVKRKGECKGHVHLVVAPQDFEEEAAKFERSLSPIFTRSFFRLADKPNTPGLVSVSNRMFQTAMWFFRDYEVQPGEPAGVPFLYNDPTWRPVQAGWCDAIQSEYFAKGMPKVLSRWKLNGGGERVVNGPVLFSPTFVRDSALLAHLSGQAHWREYLRHEIIQGLVGSQTIATGDKAALKKFEDRK